MNKKEKNITNRMRYLIDTLNKAAKVYYQTGEELMPNFEYDKLERELEALEQETGIMLSDSPTIRTGISVDDAERLTDSRLAKVTHEYPARSLAKTKDESLFPKVFSVRDNMAVLMWKEDGGTIVATYDDGKLVSLATRGNGIIGQDITHNAKYIHGLPMALPFKSHFVVRGEALMSYNEFERVNSSLPEDVEHYKNPRNLANSTINLTAEKEMEHREIWFHAFKLVYSGGNYLPEKPRTFFNDMEFLKLLGFETTEHILCSVSDLIAEMHKMTNKVSEYAFPVDGLVVAANDVEYAESQPGTGHNPNRLEGFALKWQDETVETTLRAIEWSPSRTGLLNPVAVFDPVELEGTTVSRASVKTVNLFAEKTASKYLYSTYRVKLENVYKQFPDVEELHIEGDIQQVSIRNDMFPNVKLVKSDSDRFVDGASMLIEVLYNMNRKLLNAFYMQPDMELDLKNIKYIADYALNGCLASAAINCDSLNDAAPKAFSGAFMFDTGDDGLSVINDAVLKVEPDAKSVRLSKRIRRIANSANFKNVKSLHVESINILNQIFSRNNISGITDLFVEETGAIDIRKLHRMLTSRGFDSLGNIHVENKYYTSIDGIIYSRDKQTLVLASSGRNGVVNIPEGTKTIANGAFMKSNVREVNCPDSLEYIKDNAFYACSFLKKVNFGKGLKQIGDSFRNASGVFAYCYVLNDVVIPSSVEEIGNFAFFHCDELSNVTFNEGIRGIGLSAFTFCPNLTNVELPASLIDVGLESFQEVLNITVKGGCRVFNLPSAVMMCSGFTSQEDAMNKESLIVDVNIEGKGHVYLPKYTSSEKITYTNDFFNSNWYDKEFSESVYEQAYSSRSKQILAIHIYKQTKNSDVEAYLRRAGKSIAKRMIDEGNESGAVEFLQFGLMTTAALKTILKTAEAKGAASVSSYILMQLSNKKKSTFRL